MCDWVGACLWVRACMCVCAFLLSNVSLVLTAIPPGVFSLTHPALEYCRGPNQGPSLLRFRCCIPKAISADHGTGQNKALHALPAARDCAFFILAFINTNTIQIKRHVNQPFHL